MHVRRNKFLTAFSFIATILSSCLSTMTLADEAREYWIDVRTPAEFASGHVDGAVNIEFQLIADQIAELTTDKDATIRLYCRSGRRSGVAKQSLESLGYRNTSNEGSISRALVTYQKQNTGEIPPN